MPLSCNLQAIGPVIQPFEGTRQAFGSVISSLKTHIISSISWLLSAQRLTYVYIFFLLETSPPFNFFLPNLIFSFSMLCLFHLHILNISPAFLLIQSHQQLDTFYQLRIYTNILTGRIVSPWRQYKEPSHLPKETSRYSILTHMSK